MNDNINSFTQRQLKVNEQIRHILSDIFLSGSIYDRDGKNINITISEVRVSPDLRNATVFVSQLIADKNEDDLIEDLNHLSANITYVLGKKIRLKHTPKLQFKFDNSFENAQKINNLLNNI